MNKRKIINIYRLEAIDDDDKSADICNQTFKKVFLVFQKREDFALPQSYSIFSTCTTKY